MTDWRIVRLEFAPPGPPWSTNQDRNMNPYGRAERIRLWKDVVTLLARGLPELPSSIVQVSIPFTQHRKRDPHNYCGTVLKAVIDGLVRAGVWPDDTPEWVGHREPILYKGDMVIIEITPMESDIQMSELESTGG